MATKILPFKQHDRKLGRQFSYGANSFNKTITELITNSWDSYKRLGGLSESSGMVDKLPVSYTHLTLPTN